MSIGFHAPGPRTVDSTDDDLRICAGDLLIGEVNGSTEYIEVRGLDEETTSAPYDGIAGTARATDQAWSEPASGDPDGGRGRSRPTPLSRHADARWW